jgi:DNA-binding response OmpR family regulator
MADATILLVEDDTLLAMDMQDRLEQLGYNVLGPAPSVERAHELLKAHTPDAAVLDVNLNGRSVAPIARRLQAQRIPCVLVTAYRSADITDEILLALPKLTKPVGDRELKEAMQGLLK